MARKSRQGFFATVRSGSKRKQPLGRRILGWIGMTLATVVVLGLLVLVSIRFFLPGLGAGEVETVVPVSRVLPDGSAAQFMIENVMLQVPLGEDHRGKIREGTPLKVRYVWFPQTRTVTVSDWEPADEASGAAAEDAAEPASPERTP